MNDTKKILLYAAGVYLTFICSGLYLAHGEETAQGLPPGPNPPLSSNSYGSVPKHYVVPYVTKTDPLMRRRESKSCREYLALCERSCRERGTLFKFQCIGQDFQPFQDHFRCTCADDLYVQRQSPRNEPVQPIMVQEESNAEPEQ